MSILDSIIDRFSGTSHDPVQDEAVIDLMTLVSLVDGRSGVEERDRIRAFVDGRDWPPSHNAQNYALAATSMVRAALHDDRLLDDVLTSIFERLGDARHRLFAIEAIEQVAAADDSTTRLEQVLIDDIRLRFEM